MLKEGIYEKILSAALSKKLSALPIDRFYIAQEPIDKAEASQILSSYLIDLVQLAMKEIDHSEEGSFNVAFCRIPFIVNIVSLMVLFVDLGKSMYEGEFSFRIANFLIRNFYY